MEARGSVVDLVRQRQSLAGFQKQHWQGSFEDYLDIVRAIP